MRIDSENSSDGANSNKIENSASNLSPWGKRQFQVVSNLKFLNYSKLTAQPSRAINIVSCSHSSISLPWKCWHSQKSANTWKVFSIMKFLRIFFPLRCDIRYVINVTSDLPNYFECNAKDEQLNGRNGVSDITYMRIPVDDNCSHNLAQFFPGILDFVWWIFKKNFRSDLIYRTCAFSKSRHSCSLLGWYQVILYFYFF